MPQMAPMNWTLLFTAFVCLYLIGMILVYFTRHNTSFEKDSSNSVSSPNLSWMW